MGEPCQALGFGPEAPQPLFPDSLPGKCSLTSPGGPNDAFLAVSKNADGLPDGDHVLAARQAELCGQSGGHNFTIDFYRCGNFR